MNELDQDPQKNGCGVGFRIPQQTPAEARARVRERLRCLILAVLGFGAPVLGVVVGHTAGRWGDTLLAILLAGGIIVLYVKEKARPRLWRIFGMFWIGVIAMAVSAWSEHFKSEEDRRETIALRAANLSRFPLALAEMKVAIAADQWREAEKLLEEAARINPRHADLAPAQSQIVAEVQRLDAQEHEQRRRRDLVAALGQIPLVMKTGKCKDPNVLAVIWQALRQVERRDPEYARARSLVPTLERCRRSSPREIVGAYRSLRAVGRREFAEKYDNILLDNGFNAQVTTRGSFDEQIVIKYALMSRVLVYKMANVMIHDVMRNKGFELATYTDGFGESWTFKLGVNREQAEAEAEAERKLAAGGLLGPLHLPGEPDAAHSPFSLQRPPAPNQTGTETPITRRPRKNTAGAR